MTSDRFGPMLLPSAVQLVLLFLFTLTVGSALFRGNVCGGMMVALAVTGTVIGVQYAKFSRAQSGTVLRFSEGGIEFEDHTGFHVRLYWGDIIRLDRVHLAAMYGKSIGAIGWGHRTVSPQTPDWMLNNFAAQPVNPDDGRPQVAIPLGHIDPDWMEGEMGAWFRRHRPDLMA